MITLSLYEGYYDILKITIIIYQIWNQSRILPALNRGLPCLLSIVAVGHEEQGASSRKYSPHDGLVHSSLV